MGHPRNSSDRFTRINKKKLVIAALVIGIVLLVLLVVVGVIIVAVASTLLGQTNTSIGQSIGDIISNLWKYATDFIDATWKQIVANPLQFLTGGGN